MPHSLACGAKYGNLSETGLFSWHGGVIDRRKATRKVPGEAVQNPRQKCRPTPALQLRNVKLFMDLRICWNLLKSAADRTCHRLQPGRIAVRQRKKRPAQ